MRASKSSFTWGGFRRLLKVLLPLLSFVIARAQDRIPPPNGTGLVLPPGVDRATVPLTRGRDGTLRTKVSIDGRDAGWFVLDTAASHTTIDARVAQRLNLARAAEVQVAQASGSRRMIICEALDVRLAGVRLGSRFVAVDDLAGADQAGVLGTDALRDTPVTIDFREPSLAFHVRGRMPAEVTARAKELPLQILDGCPVIRASLGGRSGRFALDTGMSGAALAVVDSFALRDEDLRPQRRLQREEAAAPGARTMRFEGLELAGHTFASVWGTLVERIPGWTMRVPQGCVGTIGVRPLSECRLTLDVIGERAWIEWGPAAEPSGATTDDSGTDGRPPLVRAAEAGDLAAVRGLLAAGGAKPDAATVGGVTALHRAAEANYPEIVGALLDAGANVNVVARDGTTPLMMATYAGSTQAAVALLDHRAGGRAATELGYTALHAAAMARRADLGRLLLAAGADVHARASDGGTALAIAALEDDPDFVRLLLAAGDDPGAKLKSGKSPLDIAMQRGNVRAIEALRRLPPGGAQLSNAKASAVVTLARSQGSPCARVSIDGQDAGWFLISLQTPAILIDTNVAQRLKLPQLGDGRTADAASFYQAKGIAIEAVGLGPRVLMAAELDRLAFVGGKIAGVLGWPALLDQPCTLDLREPSLTFYRPGSIPPEVTANAMPLRARFLPIGPAIWGKVEEETGWFRLDNSVRPEEFFEFSQSFAAERADLFRGRHLLNDVRPRMGKVVERSVTRLDWAALAGRRIAPAAVAVGVARGPQAWRRTLDGTISLPSTDLRLTLDPANHKAWLEWLEAEPADACARRLEAESSRGPAPQPALVAALGQGKFNAITPLLDHGADLNQGDISGVTPLMRAAESSAIVKQLLDRGADPNAVAALRGDTALIRAAEIGNVQSVKLLLAAGAKVDHANTLGQTALYRAAEANWPQIVDVLADAGADVNRMTRDGWTPLTTAVSRQGKETVLALVRHGANVRLAARGEASPLGIAAYNGYVAVARLLIDAHADVNQSSRDGVTPLMAAAANNQVYALRLLLGAGADPEGSIGGRTAFDFARERGQVEAMRVLRFEIAGR
ncbi:MAG TPA: ankyrin repeat domain-containing protein [Tepidisphaeraceae bacterium]|jgi:ankyrin repeat protein